jgi:FkbM family methyltransferase
MKPKHARPGTMDEVIFRHVTEGEYGPVNFKDKAVLDVGAHIGGFSVLAGTSGARLVHAFEANAENCRYLRRNCEGLPVVVHHEAVWRSDMLQDVCWVKSADPTNTGGGNVVELRENYSELVEAVALDSVLASMTFDVAKFDCEGSEYPILFTSKLFTQIPLIVGEYHPRRDNWAAEDLFKLLRDSGYAVDVKPVHSGFGKFTASQ